MLLKTLIALTGLCLVVETKSMTMSDLPAFFFMHSQNFFANGTECKTNVGATQNDILVFSKTKLPNTPKSQCVAGCMMSKIELVKNGKFDIEMFDKTTKKILGEEDPLGALIVKVSKVCTKDGNLPTDYCELGKMMSDCVGMHLQKFMDVLDA